MRQPAIHTHARVGTVVLVLAVSRLAAADGDLPPDSTPKEQELGEQAAAEVAKRYKFVEDEQWLPRLATMVKMIGPRSERPKIEYRVKIIKDETLNAFTLPGGYVYVTNGLLKYARSDHEVAGVLAHEIAHNARMHALQLIAKQRKLQWWQLLAVVGVAAGGSSGAEMGQMVMLLIDGILNGYSREAEREADEAALAYLVGSDYNPVGVLTFMELLADREQRRPHRGDPGIYQTHPLTPERVAYIKELLTKSGIPLNRRLTAGGAVAAVEKVEPVDGGAFSRVTFGGATVCEFADDGDLTRGNEVVKRINDALAHNLRMYSLKARSVDGRHVVMWGMITLVEPTGDDAKARDATPEALAKQWVAQLKSALWRESVRSGR